MTRSVEIPDAAVEAGTLAALKNYGPTWDENTESLIRADVRAALVAARPYLMPVLDRDAVDRRLETAKGHGWSIETTVDAVMEMARPMPTQAELTDWLRDIFVTDADPEGTSWDVAAELLLALLNGES